MSKKIKYKPRSLGATELTKQHTANTKSKKYCWEARETKSGWKLGLCVGSKVSYMNYYFPTTEAVERVLQNANIVFIHKQ